MENSDEWSTTIQSKYNEICNDLNLLPTFKDSAWEIYQQIRNDYSLEGDQLHWLCCAIFASTRSNSSRMISSNNSSKLSSGETNSSINSCKKPTVNENNDKTRKENSEKASAVSSQPTTSVTINNNPVSLTQLLRKCNITFYEFFKKMNKWTSMIDAPTSLRRRVNRLKTSLAVSLLVYEKYCNIFKDLFIGYPPTEDTRNTKGKRNKNIANTVHEFGWYLFICAKSEYAENTLELDLVTSFHMLLCCADLLFANAISDKRADLINTKFPDVPENFPKKSIEELRKKPVCVMSTLCERHEGTIVDAMETKAYAWKNIVTRYIKTGLLKGNENNLLNLLVSDNLDINLKSLKKFYNAFVDRIGEIDEGIFLSQSDNCNYDQIDESKRTLIHDTPLTRRHCLPGRDAFQTPVTIATQTVQRLRSHLSSYNDGTLPATLLELFKSCKEDPTDNILQIKRTMCAQFQTNFETNATERFNLSEGVYYRLLENILRSEILNKPNFDLKILNVDIFHTTLLACSVEIVIYAYRCSSKQFPWILNCFQIEAFNFYKIIEMIVLYHGDLLTRDVIKHLNIIEEQCLESLAWKSTSPLWEAIQQYGEPLPKMQDINFPEQEVLLSPLPTTNDRFTLNNSQAQNKNNIESNGDGVPTTTASAPSTQHQCSPSTSLSSSTLLPKRTGSLKLFFRKFYKLAFLRISELFKDLNLQDEEHLRKIWTIFEYSIVEQIELMRNRHLDQIFMCATYLFARVTRIEIKFKDIMFSYRAQPKCSHSRSHIYREVLINPNEDTADNKRDIITFYNLVYVQHMQTFAMKFSHNVASDLLVLSPLPPKRRNTILSPIKVSEKHSIYISGMERKDLSLTSPKSIVYSLNASLIVKEESNNANQISSNPITSNYSVTATNGLNKPLNNIILKTSSNNRTITYGKRNLQFNEEDNSNSSDKKIIKLSSNITYNYTSNNGSGKREDQL